MDLEHHSSSSRITRESHDKDGFFWRGLFHTQTLFCFSIITACADGAAQMAFSVTPSAAVKLLPNVRTLDNILTAAGMVHLRTI